MNPDRSARLIGGAFMGAGVAHFARPDFFESIVPRWIPNARLANLGSGAAEILCGAAMFPRRTRRAAAFGLLAILAAVYPANVDMYLNDVDFSAGEDGKMTRVEGAEGVKTRNLVRLPVQFLFAWMVRRHTRPVEPVGPGAGR
jgi:uncharacterized membrane protein